MAAVRRVLAGDSSAFAELVERYEGYVRATVLKHVPANAADDVAQSGFIETFRSLKSFQQRSSFRTWMTRIVLRQCYAYWNRRGRAEIPISQLSEEQAHWLDETLSTQSEAQSDQREDTRRAHEVLAIALDHLSATDRMIVTMVELEDRPIADVAEVLGWTSVRVRVRVHRAREKLRQSLETLSKQREAA